MNPPSILLAAAPVPDIFAPTLSTSSSTFASTQRTYQPRAFRQILTPSRCSLTQGGYIRNGSSLPVVSLVTSWAGEKPLALLAQIRPPSAPGQRSSMMNTANPGSGVVLWVYELLLSRASANYAFGRVTLIRGSVRTCPSDAALRLSGAGGAVRRSDAGLGRLSGAGFGSSAGNALSTPVSKSGFAPGSDAHRLSDADLCMSDAALTFGLGRRVSAANIWATGDSQASQGLFFWIEFFLAVSGYALCNPLSSSSLEIIPSNSSANSNSCFVVLIIFALLRLTLAMVADAPYRSYRADWTVEVDNYASREPTQVTRAAYRKDDGTTIFFADNLVAHLQSKDEAPAPPTVLILHWPALYRAGIHVISAILPDPNVSQNHHLHVFWNGLYARFDELKGEVVEGSYPISESWLALAEAGFGKVDAVIPFQSDTAVFFRGDRYAIVAFEFLEKGLHTRLTESGKFASRWPVLSDFGSIDYTLPEPKIGHLVFFSGQEYLSVREEYFLSDSVDMSLDQGVFLVDTLADPPVVRGQIVDLWPALLSIGFWSHQPGYNS
ncbi:hypothetical protein BDV93DRAFT_609711 [Ceratobasidium sp. AG-I]|nr:hypothetical protein BDV93DRAFT_609711 [Ceratobasidium sp. AG-I]